MTNHAIIHHTYIDILIVMTFFATDALPLSWGTIPGLGVICDDSIWIQLQNMQFIGSVYYSNNKLVLSQYIF